MRGVPIREKNPGKSGRSNDPPVLILTSLLGSFEAVRALRGQTRFQIHAIIGLIINGLLFLILDSALLLMLLARLMRPA